MIMLKCRICGGELRLLKDKYTCVNCGADFSLNQIYENHEVCICNIENDESGVRTVASHLAAEIYTLLESHKIRTYYSRVATSDLWGERLQLANISAISSAKIILFVGTKSTEFEVLSDQYGQLLQNKVVVPVFRDMDARDFPKNISAIQGVDYSRIGAAQDLAKGVLNALGRGGEYDYVATSAKSRKAKSIWLWAGIGALIIIVATLALWIALTPKDSPGNENTTQVTTDVPEITETTDIPETTFSKEELYLAAKVLADEERYADAIAMHGEIAEYKDSQKQISLLYQKYAGYYTDDETENSLHFKVSNANVANIELTCYTQDGYVCKINVTVPLQATEGSFDFVDSENNSGNVSFLLTNDAIQLQIKTTEKAGELYFPDSENVFLLEEKTDSPMRTVTIEQLISLVKTRTLVSDLKRRGIETVAQGDDGEWETLNIYEMVNTDIVLLVSWDSEPHIYAIQFPDSLLTGTTYAEVNDVVKIDDVYFLPGGVYGGDEDCIGIFTKVSTNDGADLEYLDITEGLDRHFFGTELPY